MKKARDAICSALDNFLATRRKTNVGISNGMDVDSSDQKRKREEEDAENAKANMKRARTADDINTMKFEWKTVLNILTYMPFDLWENVMQHNEMFLYALGTRDTMKLVFKRRMMMIYDIPSSVAELVWSRIEPKSLVRIEDTTTSELHHDIFDKKNKPRIDSMKRFLRYVVLVDAIFKTGDKISKEAYYGWGAFAAAARSDELFHQWSDKVATFFHNDVFKYVSLVQFISNTANTGLIEYSMREEYYDIMGVMMDIEMKKDVDQTIAVIPIRLVEESLFRGSDFYSRLNTIKMYSDEGRIPVFFDDITCSDFDENFENSESLILGKGSQGTVYEYCIPVNMFGKSCEYAVKVIKDIKLPERKKEFENETKIAKLAGSKGIGPRVFASKLCNTTGYVFMQKLNGTVFDTYLRTLKWSSLETEEQNLNSVTTSIFFGIHKLHKLGYVHRDLHTYNIWVNKDGSVYILDYGSTISIEGEKSTFSLFKKDYNNFVDGVISRLRNMFISNEIIAKIQNNLNKKKQEFLVKDFVD